MDFVAAENFRVPYSHDKRFYTYKMDYEPLVISSGIMEKDFQMQWYVSQQDNKFRLIDSESLSPFLNNELNYHARKAVVFTKNHALLPIYHASDFAIR